MIKTRTMEKATFGAGCFWGVEKSFKKKFPALEMSVGYIGGTTPNPTYQQVCSGKTGYAEAIQIQFNDSAIYKDLVDFFYRMHDPTTLNKQGNDAGSQYRSAIFYHSDQQLEVAKSVSEYAKTVYKNVSTTLEVAGVYYPAESYHQDYLTVNPHGYECSTHFERSWEKIMMSSLGKGK